MRMEIRHDIHIAERVWSARSAGLFFGFGTCCQSSDKAGQSVNQLLVSCRRRGQMTSCKSTGAVWLESQTERLHLPVLR
jgi:hypothetical protein